MKKNLFELNEEIQTSTNELVKMKSYYVLELIGDKLYGTHPSLVQSFLLTSGHVISDRLKEKLEIYIHLALKENKDEKEKY